MYEIFEQLLSKYHVTPYKVGKATGIAASTFTDWKNGKSEPKKEKLQKIANYFGVSIDYFMGASNETDNETKVSLSKEELERLQVLKLNDKLRVLIDETQKLSPVDIDFVLSMVERLKSEGKID
jgi:transcriptional regulator with XRE-family HTH domain